MSGWYSAGTKGNNERTILKPTREAQKTPSKQPQTVAELVSNVSTVGKKRGAVSVKSIRARDTAVAVAGGQKTFDVAECRENSICAAPTHLRRYK